MKKISMIILLIIIVTMIPLSACGISKPSTTTIENVKYVDADPFENCTSCSYGVYEKENGEQFKLPTSNEYLKQMVNGSTYDIEYEVTSFDYPEHEVVNFRVSQGKKDK